MFTQMTTLLIYFDTDLNEWSVTLVLQTNCTLWSTVRIAFLKCSFLYLCKYIHFRRNHRCRCSWKTHQCCYRRHSHHSLRYQPHTRRYLQASKQRRRILSHNLIMLLWLTYSEVFGIYYWKYMSVFLICMDARLCRPPVQTRQTKWWSESINFDWNIHSSSSL